MARSSELSVAERWMWLGAFVAGAAVVGVAIYFIFQSSAADVSASIQNSRKDDRDARCASINAEIAKVDRLARQPSTSPAQDSLRETRAKLVNEKFARKC